MESPQPLPIENELLVHYRQLDDHLLRKYLQVLEDQLEEQDKFIKSINILLDDYLRQLEKSSDGLINATTTFNEALKPLIKNRYNESGENTFDKEFQSFNIETSLYISSLDSRIKKAQDKQRFYSQPDDTFILKNLKYFKRQIFFFSQLPVRTGNIFRRLFGKPAKFPKVWHHKIPLQQISKFYFRDVLAVGFLALLKDVNELLINSNQQLYQLTSQPDETIINLGVEKAAPVILSLDLSYGFKGLIDEIEGFKGNLETKASEILKKVFLEYQDTYNKINTIELSGKKFNDQKLQSKHHEVNELYLKTNKGWGNTYFALFEVWRLDNERFLLKYKLLSSLDKFKNKLSERIDLNIVPKLSSIATSLTESQKKFKDFAGDKPELKALLISQRRFILKDLRHKKVPIAMESLIEQELAKLVGQIEIELGDNILNLTANATLLKSKTFSKETRLSDLHNFSLHELISHDTYPVFKKAVGHVKSSLVQDLDKVQKTLSEVNNISDFNLESALAMLEREEMSSEESLASAKEGLLRAGSKCEVIEKEIISIKEKVMIGLEAAVAVFIKQLDELSDIEEIFDLQIRIAKAKALTRGKVYKGKAQDLFNESVPFVINYATRKVRQSIQYYNKLRDYYGLSKAPTLISAEISDYLAEVKSAISLLPFVYQRLFDVVPLKDRTFYEERTKEMIVLKRAYENWDRGHFAPTVVVGERGAGATTLINFFIKDQTTNYRVLRVSEFERPLNEGFIVKSIGSLFKDDDIDSSDDLIGFINALPDKYVIIFENLQQYYLRKVGGFEMLKVLLKIMSRTHKKIFWISTCTIYSWNYLNKIIDISDFFGYINFLRGLEDEKIVQVILKRHQVSGYNIQFEPSITDRLSRKYKSLTDLEKQAYLQTQFFISLNKFAGSNLSLALVYWLRSTKKVNGDTIIIGSMNANKFDFLSAISIEKLTILHALLLHETLSDTTVSDVLSRDIEDCSMLLLLLYDDGIIVKESNGYSINPLLYRQTVNILKSKNFIQ